MARRPPQQGREPWILRNAGNVRAYTNAQGRPIPLARVIPNPAVPRGQATFATLSDKWRALLAQYGDRTELRPILIYRQPVGPPTYVSSRRNWDSADVDVPLAATLGQGLYNAEALGDAVLDNVISLDLWLFPKERRAGGCKPGRAANDCLWRAVLEAFGGNRPYEVRSNEAMCEAIGAVAGEPVPLTAIPALEQLLHGVRINVRGLQGALHLSKAPGPQVIELSLSAGHYTFRHPQGRPHHFASVAKEDVERRPCRVFVREGDGYVLHAPDGGKTLVGGEEFSQMIRCRRYAKCPYMLIALKDLLNPGKPITPAELFEQRATIREALKPLGLDFQRFTTVKDWALDFWWLRSGTVPELPALTVAEEAWIAGTEGGSRFPALRGGLIYTATKPAPQAIALDFVSMYPSVMCSQTMLPMVAREATILAALKPHPSLGLYRCRITVPPRLRALWRGTEPGEVGIYTHTDIEIAKLLGATIELVCDGEPNAVVYTSEKGCAVRAEKVFEPFVKPLFELKRAGVAIAKLPLNVLWGSLCERQTVYLTQAAPVQLPTNDIRDIICDLEKDTADLVVAGTRNPETGELGVGPTFKHNYARWAPFLTAAARLRMVKLALPHAESLLHCHTDSVTIAVDPGCPTAAAWLAAHPAFGGLVGRDLGCLKLENFGAWAPNSDRRRRPTWSPAP